MWSSLRGALRVAVPAIAAALIGCSGGIAGKGTVEVLLTDFPLGEAEVKEVWIRILNVQACRDDEGCAVIADFGPEGTLRDLLTLVDDVTVLGLAEIEAGHYGQIRLLLGTEHTIVVDAGDGPATHPLRVPSGVQTGLKLAGDFDVTEAGVTRIVLDFDAQQSVVLGGDGRYHLKPVVRIAEVVARPFLVDDGFEGYEAASYPAASGWYELWSGAGVAAVVEGPAHGGSKSFMLQGYTTWVRADGITLDLTGRDRLAYRVAVRVPSGSPTGARVGFFERYSPTESRDLNAVGLDPGAPIWAVGTEWRATSITCQADTWYEVRVEIDHAALTMDVWIDGVKALDDLPAHAPIDPAVFFVGTAWSGSLAGISTAFFDDVMVY